MQDERPTPDHPDPHGAELLRLRRHIQALWAVLLLVAIASGSLFAWNQRGPSQPGTREMPPPDPEQRAYFTEEIIKNNDEFRRDVRERAGVLFDRQEVSRVARGEPKWLQSFIEEQALEPDTAQTLCEILSTYMMRCNEIHLEEYLGSHTPKNSTSFYKVEHQRLMRSLIVLLSSERAAVLEPDLTLHGFKRR